RAAGRASAGGATPASTPHASPRWPRDPVRPPPGSSPSSSPQLTMTRVIATGVQQYDERHSRWKDVVMAERTPRERMVFAAVQSIRERGVAGTALRDVVERAEAPRGSLQHYFPGGKDQLVAEAVA